MKEKSNSYGESIDSLQENEENRDWIYLIKPNTFTPDSVYKVFEKDN